MRASSVTSSRSRPLTRSSCAVSAFLEAASQQPDIIVDRKPRPPGSRHQHREPSMTSRNLKTRLVHPQTSAPQGFRSLATPVFRGSTTLFEKAAAIRDTWNHDDAPYTYGSYGTPTTLELAARLAELEGGRRCFITPGGQAALVLVYVAFLSAGDHVLVPATVYGPSRGFADRVLRRLGVEVEYYEPDAGAAIASKIRPQTRLVWCESPGSITMDVQDVPAIAAAAHARGVTVALDNT